MAMLNYQAEHGRLPPAVVYGDSGQPLYSWRVLVLPYIEQESLYKEFHLDEPWDSPHNITLLPKMPGVYAPPSHKQSRVPPYNTVCHVFVGKGAAFEGREGLRLPADFPDGVSNTFPVVEAGEPVPWTKPEDLVYDPDGPLPELRCLFNDGFRARMADCAGRFVRKGTSEAALRAAITRNAGDTLGPDW
jgi:hypothetical protein